MREGRRGGRNTPRQDANVLTREERKEKKDGGK